MKQAIFKGLTGLLAAAALSLAARGASAACTTDADCGGPQSGIVCDEGASGACVPGCRGAGGNGCPDGETCSSGDHTPGNCAPTPGCTTDADCGSLTSGQVCDSSSGTCFEGCRGADGNGCPDGLLCTSEDDTLGACVGCLADDNCGGPTSGKVCDDGTRTCITGCRGYSYYGNGNTCLVGLTCTSTGETIGQCVVCVHDYDCGYGSGQICDTNQTCVAGCRGEGYGAECPAGQLCSSEGETPGLCSVSTETITVSGNGPICAARPGSTGDPRLPWAVAVLAGTVLSRRRRRRDS